MHGDFTRENQSLGVLDVQTVFELDDEGSQMLAKLLRAVRGPDAIGTSPAECRRVTPAAMHDVWHVRRMTIKPLICLIAGPVARIALGRLRRSCDHSANDVMPLEPCTETCVSLFYFVAKY